MMVFQDDLFQPKNAKKSALDNDAITESANQNRIIAKHFQITGLDGTVNICINVLTKEVLWKARVSIVKATADIYLIACPLCEECSYGDRLSSLEPSSNKLGAKHSFNQAQQTPFICQLKTIAAAKRLNTCFIKSINKKRDLQFFSKICACNSLFKYFCCPLRVEAIFPCGHFFFSTHTAVSEGIFRLSCHQYFLLNTSRKLKGEELKTEEIWMYLAGQRDILFMCSQKLWWKKNTAALKVDSITREKLETKRRKR